MAIGGIVECGRRGGLVKRKKDEAWDVLNACLRLNWDFMLGFNSPAGQTAAKNDQDWLQLAQEIELADRTMAFRWIRVLPGTEPGEFYALVGGLLRYFVLKVDCTMNVECGRVYGRYTAADFEDAKKWNRY